MKSITNYSYDLLQDLKRSGAVAVDTETKSLTDRTMVDFSVAYDDGAFYVPVIDEVLDTMPIAKARTLLNFLIKQCTIVMHNSSFDLPVLYNFGVDIYEGNY